MSVMGILLLGFIFAACLLFGEGGQEFSNFQNSASQLFFSVMRSTAYSTFERTTNKRILSAAFFLIFLFLFNFILMKTLISIVILRYRTIRSLKLLEIQAHSRVIGKDTKRVRQKW
jgi:hypothetical protein